jgi:hypothetical protein
MGCMLEACGTVKGRFIPNAVKDERVVGLGRWCRTEGNDNGAGALVKRE